MKWLRVLSVAASFVLWNAIALPLAIVGLFVVPIGMLFTRVEASPITGLPIVSLPRWLWLWSNDEDGICPKWYGSTRWAAYRWTCLRNSVNNLRFVRWLSPPIEPSRVKYAPLGTAGGWIAWQGLRAGLVYGKLRVGWNVDPYVARGWLNKPVDYRTTGMGFLTDYGVQQEWQL